MSSLIKRLQQRYVVEGDELARDALACLRECGAALNALVAAIDPKEVKPRAPLLNAKAVLRKLNGGK